MRGQLLAHWSARLVGWHAAELPVQLPAGARLLWAKVDGRLVPLPPPVNGVLMLPCTAAPSMEASILYSTATPAWYVAASFAAPAPLLPFPLPLRRVWRLSPGLAPALPEYWRPCPETARVRTEELGADRTLDWEAPPGEDGQRLTLVQPTAPTIVSGILAGLFIVAILIGWVGNWRRLRTFLLLALVLSGLASLWLPTGLRDLARWPLVVAVAAVFGVLLAALASRRRDLRRVVPSLASRRQRWR